MPAGSFRPQEGNDVVVGGPKDNDFTSGPGADLFFCRCQGSNSVTYNSDNWGFNENHEFTNGPGAIVKTHTPSVTVSLNQAFGDDGNAEDGPPGARDSLLGNCALPWGTSGNDILIGDNNANYAYGGAGNDILLGRGGNDWLEGDSGDDLLFDEYGSLTGGGNDILQGNSGNDYLYGQSGDDEIYGGAGHDELYGDAGNDTLTSTGDLNGFVFWSDLDSCGSGTDTVYYNTLPYYYPDLLLDDPPDICENRQVLNRNP